MLQVDEFESAFRSADKLVFTLRTPSIQRAMIVTDLDEARCAEFAEATQALLAVVGDEATWRTYGEKDFSDVYEMVRLLEDFRPDMVVSYRNLRDTSWRYPYSLGAYLNVLTREVDVPVLVLPNPHEYPDLPWQQGGTDDVMVVTDHLAGDHSLVNWGVRFTNRGGRLILTHLEDDAIFHRYMQVISKIPGIDTEQANALIKAQLLKEPADYIASCQRVIRDAGIPITIESHIAMGHRVLDYQALMQAHDVELLAFHASFEGNVAMHGAAYFLALATREKPVLLL